MHQLILNAYNFASGNSLAVVVEFAVVFIIVIATYFAVHKTFTKKKPAIKFIIATVIGITGYSIGKAVVFVWIIQPVIAQTITKSAVFY